MDASAATIIAQANARASLMCSVSAATDGRKKAIKKALDKENDEWREKYVERPAEHFRLNLIGHGFGIDEDHSCYADVDRENLQLAREYYAQNDRQIGSHGQSACQDRSRAAGWRSEPRCCDVISPQFSDLGAIEMRMQALRLQQHELDVLSGCVCT